MKASGYRFMLRKGGRGQRFRLYGSSRLFPGRFAGLVVSLFLP